MEIEYSSEPEQEKIYTTVKLRENANTHGGFVEVGCWVNNADSRKECAAATKEEAIRILKLSLSALDSQ
jgi:predicted SAM-dependent methyltransferase